ncbi:glycoside hydrolase family 4 [Ignisphaera aggregans DSM 17230]|uniref:Glycoside hydrolase family 4 n=1 Tax=Ignisphaera aggregans (strain DSM 17230 / JCM 13409 / AQ1.S1) TaxID=583356 RepID=E0SR63_IGNAA|nr:glycoside hydrolase family 4 [Ignisphaera aggregans DSM 17230]
MSQGPKISFIGAGSARWTSRILVDIFMNKDLHNAEIWLMDIDDRRLNIIDTLARRLVNELKLPIKVYATKDRRKAIKDADFVISTALPKGYTYYETMRDISEKYGYYRGINSVEWNMVADYHTIWGYYLFKLHLDIARDIEELAPNAWFFIVSNPVLELTTMIARETKVKVAGICHGFLGFRAAIEVLAMRLSKQMLGKDITSYCAAHMPECYDYMAKVIDFSDIEIEMKGLNHDIWLTRFRYKGEDTYKYIDEWIKEDAEKYWSVWREYTTNPWNLDLCPAAIDMYRTYGLLPIGDTVRGGTWKYHWDLKTKQYWYGQYGEPDSEIGCAIRIQIVRRNIEEMANIAFNMSTPVSQRISLKPSGEVIVSLIDSIYNDKHTESYEINVPRIGSVKAPIYVNVLNNGSVPGIPDNVAVETHVRVDGKGIHPIQTSGLPSKVFKYAILPRIMRLEWALEANLKGGRDTLVEWLIVDVRTNSMKQVNDVIDAILSMPGNEEIAKHFS